MRPHFKNKIAVLTNYLFTSCANSKNVVVVKYFVGGQYQLQLHEFSISSIANLHSKDSLATVVTKCLLKLQIFAVQGYQQCNENMNMVSKHLDISTNVMCYAFHAWLGTFLLYTLGQLSTHQLLVLPYSGKIWRALNLAKWRKKVVF